MLSLFGAIGRLLPGYIQGERMAVQDNWNDLNQYNQVQQGQLANAFTEATFHPAVNIFNDRAMLSRLGALSAGMDYRRRAENYPMELQTAAAQAAWNPYLANLYGAVQANNSLDPYWRLPQQQAAYPWLFQQPQQQPMQRPEDVLHRPQQALPPQQTPTVAR